MAATCSTDVASAAAAGRRIYIHEDSLADLARQSSRGARLVFAMLGRMATVKVTHHMIGQDAVRMGEISEERAQAIVESLRAGWARDVSSTLRQIEVRRGHANRPRTFERVLADDESVVATCYFSNYYTFATDDASSEEMFADTTPIGVIRELKQRGEGYDDLDLINGTNLRLKDVGTPPQKKLPPEDLDAIRAETYREIETEFDRLVGVDLPAGGMVREARTILLQAFSRGILRMRDATP